MAYYYEKLNNKQKTIYSSLQTGIESLSKEIVLPLMRADEVKLIFEYILLDNPLIFYVRSYRIYLDGSCRILPDYRYDFSVVNDYTQRIIRHLKVFDPARHKTHMEKELFVHDYCLNHFKYDYSFADHCFSVLGPILNNTGVCEGITKYVKLSLDYLGVNSLVVNGEAINPSSGQREPHAWNIVDIMGNTYHLDVTFDLTLKTQANRYDYFNLTDKDISKDHVYENNLPRCISEGKDYFSMQGAIANSPTELCRYIGKTLRQGKKHIMVKLRHVEDEKTIADKVMSIASMEYKQIFNKSVAVSISCNLRQAVFEISFT